MEKSVKKIHAEIICLYYNEFQALNWNFTMEGNAGSRFKWKCFTLLIKVPL
jgi:hypothetical protein